MWVEQWHVFTAKINIYDKSNVYFCLTSISDFYLWGRKAVDFFLGETSSALKHEDNR